MPRPDVLAHVAANLRRLRAASGLTQAALAEAAGMSRRMYVQLEGGDTNVSLSTLDRIADALGVDFVTVVSDPGSSRRHIDALMWRGKDENSKAVLLGSAPATAQAQLWSWSLGPGDCYVAEPDPPGWHEMIFVIEGRLLIHLEEGDLTVGAGEHAIYSSSQDFAYQNIHEGTTRFIRNVVS